MKLYRITWRTNGYAQSFVRANSEKEAKEKAFNNEDEDFEIDYPDDTWDINGINEVKEVE